MSNASDLLVDGLIEQGVKFVFGLPGDGVNGVMEALRIRQDRIRFIQARHEEAAAFMACAYAKWTGKLGVCLATTGPGGVHLLNGLYDAKFDRAPVLAITGLPYHDLIQTYTQQDVDHVRLFQDVAEYTTAVFGAQHIRLALAQACRTAMARRSVAHLAIPTDVQEQEIDDDAASPRHVVEPTLTWAEGMRAPDPDDVARAAEILNSCRKVVILAGQGALGAGEILARTADLLAAPVAKALLGKAVLPDAHPHATGGVGYLGARPSQQALEVCDGLLIVGSNFPYLEYYPEQGQARAVQIDLDAARVGMRYPVEGALIGDAAASLKALNDRLERKTDRRFLEQTQIWKAEWLEALEAGADRPGTPMKPQRIVRDLNRRLPPNAVVTTDCGHNTGLTAQYVQIRADQAFGVSGTLACMGAGLPYAIAAALAFPGRPVVAIVGDGGLSMSMAELATCARYNLPVKIVVLNNGTLGQIKWEQMMFLGNPEFGCDLAPIDFARAAEAMGVHGVRIENPEDCADALDDILGWSGPALLDVVVDSDEPMLPPKRRETYMKKMQQAFEAGTPGQERIKAAMEEEPARTSLLP